MADFLILQPNDVPRMSENITRMSANRGGIRIGAILTKKIEALVFWCHERNRSGQSLDANQFTAAAMQSTLQRISVEAADDESPPELPKEFKAVKWVPWLRHVENYLWQVKGCIGVPLIYVIRKDRVATAPPFSSEAEQRIYSVTLRGEAYQKDNGKVMQILTQLLADTPAWTWIS